MKPSNHYYLILFTLAFNLVSCTWQGNEKVFTASEQLMAEHPDSALNLLLDVKPESRRQCAKHALLLSMALDKNYIDVTDDSLTLLAYNYYQRHGNTHDKMLSAYYLGVVRQNSGDYLQAALLFDQALTLAKELEDNHNAGLCCRHLSSIHAFNYNHVLALEYSKQAADFFDACGETLSADYARINMAMQMIRARKWDESLVIIDDVISRNSYPPLIQISMENRIEVLLWGKEDFAGANECLDKITIGKDYADSMIFYGNKGYISEALGKTSDSKKYFNLAQSYIKDAIDTLTIYDQMSRAFKMQGDYKNAYYYLLTAGELQNKQVTEILGQSVSGAFEEYYRDSLKNQKERSRLNNIIYISLAAVLLMIIVLLSLITRKLHFDRIQDIANIESLTNDLQVLQSRNEHFRKASDAVIIDKVRFLQQLSDSYFSWTDEEVMKREKLKGAQTKDEIISLFRRQIGEMRADKSLVLSLEQAVDASNDNIVQRLRQEYKGIFKERDYTILTMFFAGLSIKSIAYFLRMSEPSLRTRKTRYKTLFQDQPVPSSPDFIRMLG